MSQPNYTAEDIIATLAGVELETRNGTKAKLTSYDNNRVYPLAGGWWDNNDWSANEWSLAGQFNTFAGEGGLDINIPYWMEKVKAERKAALERHQAVTVVEPTPDLIKAIGVAIGLFDNMVMQDFHNDCPLDGIKELLDHRHELIKLKAKLEA